MAQKRLLILGGAEFQIPLIKEAKSKNLLVGVIDMKVDAPAKKYSDVFYQASLKDWDKVLHFAKKFSPNGITAGMVDIAVPVCAYVSSILNLPGISMETAKKATDKFEMIKAFEQNNVPHPYYQYVSKSFIKNTDIQLPYPLIVKPVDMAGSRGINLVHNENELFNALQDSSRASDSGNVIIEEYLEGPEVSVELVVRNAIPYVIQVTDKATSGAPHFAETGHLQPSQLPCDVIKKIKDVACAAATSLGLVNSLGHAEIKVTGEGPKMVEIGARAGGDGIGEQLIELSTGVNFSDLAIKIALGENFEISENRIDQSSCIQFILSENGVLQSIQGVEKAKALNNIYDVKITAENGRRYASMVDNSGRIGYVISQANNAKLAKEACEKALKLITVSYAKEDD